MLEPTPRPGGRVTSSPCQYFLVLSVRPDESTVVKDAGLQVNLEDETKVSVHAENTPEEVSKGPLLYVALLSTKDEAPAAVKCLLAQVNNDHANFPSEIVFRLHSDCGSEFMNESLKTYCADHGIHKTSTAGYDPNANASAESAVGYIKRRSRYLLSLTRLPTNWWGMAALAAAQLSRADAGLVNYPRIAFGTRVMVVTDPAPRNCFAPRAEPATLFGPSSSVSDGFWIYQKGCTMVKTNLQPQGLMEEDISWVKVNLENWSSPDAPLPPPEPQLYDAALLTPTTSDLHDAATRENATCPACQQLRRKRKVKDRHTLVWGECLRAFPPPPVPVGHVPDLAVDVQDLPEIDRPADVHEDDPENTVR